MARIAALLCMALLVSSCSLDSFLYDPERLDEYVLDTDIIPEADRTQVTFDSDGHTLYGYWVTPENPVTPRRAVLYCHGNKRHIGEYWDRVEQLYLLGLDCFIFDYRGFGRSEGTPSISGLYADGRAALRYLIEALHVDSADVIFYGYSLGNVVAIDLAAHVMAPYRLVAEAPMASIEALFRASTPLNLPGGFVIDDEADNVARIRQIHTPLLLLHGDADDFIPWDRNGRVIYENAPAPKQLELVHGANHTDIPWVLGPEIYRARLWQFVQ